jgi:hypothetical protein
MRIDGTDPFATAKPDARLIKLELTPPPAALSRIRCCEHLGALARVGGYLPFGVGAGRRCVRSAFLG